MMTELLEMYIKSPFEIPLFLKQPMANFLVGLDNRICVLLGGNYSPGAPDSEEIAAQSSELMSVHYDQPLHIFEKFLGESMKYSMGLWEEGASTLEEAQEAMMADLCKKAGIEDGQNILDIGCGFGSFAGHVLKHFPNCTMRGLTLSKVQAAYMMAKQKERGHPLNSKRFDLVEGDFNDARFNEKSDRIVSIGVWEHITNLDKAQAKVRSFLKPNGKVLLHYITYFEPLAGITRRPLQSNLVTKHIFPAGRIWSAGELAKHQKDLAVEQTWLLNGSNYERTIKCWVDNLRRNKEKLLELGVKQETIKLWDLYFRFCVGVFHAKRGTYYGNAQYLLTPA